MKGMAARPPRSPAVLRPSTCMPEKMHILLLDLFNSGIYFKAQPQTRMELPTAPLLTACAPSAAAYFAMLTHRPY